MMGTIVWDKPAASIFWTEKDDENEDRQSRLLWNVDW
jgi:hypothetical protein